MGASLRKVFEKHQDELLKNTNLSLEDIRKVKYLHEFDREVQCKTWGYPTEDSYYRDASSVDTVLALRIPTLCLHATDDPIASDEAVPYSEIRQNPYVVLCATNGGGHLSWFEWGGGRWHTRPVSMLTASSSPWKTAEVVTGRQLPQRHGQRHRLLQDRGAQVFGQRCTRRAPKPVCLPTNAEETACAGQRMVDVIMRHSLGIVE